MDVRLVSFLLLVIAFTTCNGKFISRTGMRKADADIIEDGSAVEKIVRRTKTNDGESTENKNKRMQGISKKVATFLNVEVKDAFLGVEENLAKAFEVIEANNAKATLPEIYKYIMGVLTDADRDQRDIFNPDHRRIIIGIMIMNRLRDTIKGHDGYTDDRVLDLAGMKVILNAMQDEILNGFGKRMHMEMSRAFVGMFKLMITGEYPKDKEGEGEGENGGAEAEVKDAEKKSAIIEEMEEEENIEELNDDSTDVTNLVNELNDIESEITGIMEDIKSRN